MFPAESAPHPLNFDKGRLRGMVTALGAAILALGVYSIIDPAKKQPDQPKPYLSYTYPGRQINFLSQGRVEINFLNKSGHRVNAALIQSCMGNEVVDTALPHQPLTSAQRAEVDNSQNCASGELTPSTYNFPGKPQ
jgi:hypothetical protein